MNITQNEKSKSQLDWKLRPQKEKEKERKRKGRKKRREGGDEVKEIKKKPCKCWEISSSNEIF